MKQEVTELIRLITDKVNLIVLIITPEGNVKYVSNSSERILGYKPEELIGKSWWKATRKDENTAFAMLETFKQNVKNHNFDELSSERMLKTKDNNWIWILWQSSFDHNGNIVSVGYDITSRKQKEMFIEKSLHLLEIKNKELTDSMNYASHIQRSILPNMERYKEYFSMIHINFLPKEIVSGDFYFIYKKNECVYIACIDCTGHGVPGALMTILSRNILKQVIKSDNTQNPATILYQLDEHLQEDINQNIYIKRADGMDISLIINDLSSSEFHFAGANHSIFLKQDLLLREIKGDRFPIGLYNDVVKKFNTHSFSYTKGDQIYMFTDGFQDQFGGPKNKKLTKKRIQQILQNNNLINLNCEEIDQKFHAWKGKNEQTDDCLLIAFEF